MTSRARLALRQAEVLKDLRNVLCMEPKTEVLKVLTKGAVLR